VDLTGELPVSEAMDRIGRQLNRRIEVYWHKDPRLAKTAQFNLKNATAAEALAALEQASGMRTYRRGRWAMALTTYGERGAGVLWRAADGWQVGIQTATYNYNSALVPGSAEPPRVTRHHLLTHVLRPLNEWHGLALVDAAVPVVEAVAGEACTTKNNYWHADQEGGAVTMWQTVEGVAPTLRALAKVSVTLTLSDLQETVFRFDVPADKESRTLTEGGQTLTVRRDGRTLGLQATLPILEAEADSGVRRRLFQLSRERCLEARFFMADGRPLYTQTDSAGHEVHDRNVLMRWTAHAQGDDRALPVARIEVRLVRRTGEPRQQTVVLERVPLPATKEAP
jgi:hypothetical protein